MNIIQRWIEKKRSDIVIDERQQKKALLKIYGFAKTHHSCDTQSNKFIGFIESENYVLAWETVVGNLDWLIVNGIKINWNKVIALSGYVGTKWNYDGSISYSGSYIMGHNHPVPHGLFKFNRWNGEPMYTMVYDMGKPVTETKTMKQYGI